MLRIPILTHLAVDVLCGVLGLVPGVLYLVLWDRDGPHHAPGPSTRTAVSLFVIGVVVGRLIPWLTVVGRCPDCGGRARLVWRGGPRMAWRAAPRGSSPIYYRCSHCGTYTETGVSCGPD